MRITLFIGGLSGGGAERVTCNLANYLSGKKHDVDVLTLTNEPSAYHLDRIIKRENLTGGIFSCTPLRNVARILQLAQYLLFRKRDVIVVLLPRTTFMLLRMRAFTSAKIIAAQRVMPSSLKKENQKKLKKLACKANGWTFQTEEQRQWFGETLQNAKAIVIPNAINPDFIQERFKGDWRYEIVTAGRMTLQKNQKLLLSAFANIHKSYPNYKLVIYGEGPEKNNLVQLANSLQIADSVLFPGYITSVGEKIKGASIFILSSDYEGMPNALMEAMALGLPCISTDCDGGGARFLIENEKNGLLVPKGDVNALAVAMDRMLSDREFAEQCGREAHKICERLAPEKIYGEWESFIKEIAENNKQ